MEVKSRRAEHAADTRASLLAAARTLFAEHGYAGTGTEEVVARARVTRGALYHHFRNKQDLFAAVVTELTSELLDQLVTRAASADWVSTYADLWDQIRAGHEAYLDLCLDPEFRQIVLIDGPAVLGQAAWSELDQERISLMRTWLEEAMARGAIDRVPVDPLAHLLNALVTDASIYVARAADRLAARAEAGAALDRILTGLRPHTGIDQSGEAVPR